MRVLFETRGEVPVAEDLLDGGLRVVEVALDRAHVDVGTLLRRHLEFLHAADAALRVEDGDAGALGVGEAGERGLAGVAGGGRDDHDLLVRVAVGGRRARHEARQDLQGDVLERGGGAVEQFHDPVLSERLDRRDALVRPLRPVGLGDACLEFFFGEVVEEHGEHVIGDLLVAPAGEVVDGDEAFAEFVGDEEAAVVRDALADGLLRGQ